MNEEAAALLRLQEIDLSLMRAEAQLKAMPQASKLVTVAQAKKKLASELKRIVGMRKDIEIDIDDLQQQHARYEQDRADAKASIEESGKSYKEVQALDTRLSNIAKQLEKVEFKLGPLLDKLDQARGAEAKLNAIGAKLDEEEGSLRDSFAADTTQIRAEIKSLQEERADTLEDITEGVLADYTAASKRFSGLAVERMKGNVPSTCRVKLQEDAYRVLVRGPEITTCPYCHRMLVVEEL
jgi:predicted  nucleic acid-binding Zn-ribbon protein